MALLSVVAAPVARTKLTVTIAVPSDSVANVTTSLVTVGAGSLEALTSSCTKPLNRSDRSNVLDPFGTTRVTLAPILRTHSATLIDSADSVL